MKTPINIKTIRKHMLYNSWKYILLVALSLIGWNLIFTMTAYRPPQEKIVDLYIYGSLEYQGLEDYWKKLNAEELPQMEQMDVVAVMDDNTYGDMVLLARVAAGEGDIYLLPKEKFQGYAAEGYLVALENNEAGDAIAAAGLNMERGTYRLNETGERHAYGVPISQLPGLEKYVTIPSTEYFVAIMTNNQNDENVMHAMACFLRDMSAAPEVN